MLNPVYERAPEGLVHIGARPSVESPVGRTANPGLIFAECLDVTGADPGILYDTDEIKGLLVLVRQDARASSRSREQRAICRERRHANHTQLRDERDSSKCPGSSDWWVFYTVSLGDHWRPGGYVISFVVTWSNAISDGYEDFGPGTANERLESGCRFAIQKNPYGLEIMPERPNYPLQTFPFQRWFEE